MTTREERLEYYRKRYREIKAGTRQPMRMGRPTKARIQEMADYEVRLAAATERFLSFTANGVKTKL